MKRSRLIEIPEMRRIRRLHFIGIGGAGMSGSGAVAGQLTSSQLTHPQVKARNAIIATDIEGARKRAKAADRAVRAGKKLGPLHGVPMTIKEANWQVGTPTTWGMEMWRDWTAPVDGLGVRLERAVDGRLPAEPARVQHSGRRHRVAQGQGRPGEHRAGNQAPEADD